MDNAVATPEPSPASPPVEEDGKRRTLLGRVVGDRMDKTITVLVERQVRHPLYGKYIRRSRKMLAHDEENRCRLGDVVVVEECRRLAKRKSWRLSKILKRAETAAVGGKEA